MAETVKIVGITPALAMVLVVALAAAVFIAGYHTKQRTEQACLAAGHPPDVCRTSLENL
jgi:hypothetical protein